jgi:ribosomal-protein-alanine N-acetyltransferase
MEYQPEIRAYQTEDKEAVLALLRLNTPAYFAPEEEQHLVQYLDHEIGQYFVIECDGVIAGSGGINITADGTTGKISWDMIHPAYQRQSLGTMLLRYRVKLLQTYNPDTIMVRTSQHVYRFYEKCGFRLVEQVKDYWAEGFDLYRMEYAGEGETS